MFGKQFNQNEWDAPRLVERIHQIHNLQESNPRTFDMVFRLLAIKMYAFCPRNLFPGISENGTRNQRIGRRLVIHTQAA
jgi:hypothetical protein